MELNDVIFSAISALEAGCSLLYPTDTIWGLGCDATNADAVQKLYSVKRRDHSKSMLVLCSDIAMVERYVGRVGEEARRLLLESSQPTTVIMPLQHSLLADNLAAADGTIGVRLPRMDFCQSLLLAFGKPIVSTSANLSGQPSPLHFSDISEEIKKAADFVVPAFLETDSSGAASRIVKVMPDGGVSVIR